MTDDERDPLDGVEQSRRDFIKKMAVVAFAAPVISSFGMSSLASASSKGSNNPPKQSHPNQSEPPCDPPKQPDPPRKPDPPKKPGRW